jgi:glycosidase
MQWTDDDNGGFSTAEPKRLVAPVVTGGFAPRHVNAQAQRRDPDSLLAFVSHLVQRYRECPELGWGEFEVVDQPVPSVLAHRCTWDDASLVAVHNLSAEPAEVPLSLGDVEDGTTLVDLLVDGVTDVDTDGLATVALEGYGFRGLRVATPGQRRLL